MDELNLTIDRLKDLLNIMDYQLDYDKNIPIFKPIEIIRNGNKVGYIKLEKKNLYYMNKTNKQVENRNLRSMKFDW